MALCEQSPGWAKRRVRLVSAPRHRALGGGLLGGRLPAPRPLCQGWQESCCCRQHVSCSVPVPEQCQCLTVVSTSSETQEMCLEHEVSWTTCSSSAEGLSAAKLQGQPFSPFKYKHLLHSKLFFFQVYSSHLWVFSTIPNGNRCLEKLITHMFKP